MRKFLAQFLEALPEQVLLGEEFLAPGEGPRGVAEFFDVVFLDAHGAGDLLPDGKKLGPGIFLLAVSGLQVGDFGGATARGPEHRASVHVAERRAGSEMLQDRLHNFGPPLREPLAELLVDALEAKGGAVPLDAKAKLLHARGERGPE